MPPDLSAIDQYASRRGRGIRSGETPLHPLVEVNGIGIGFTIREPVGKTDVVNAGIPKINRFDLLEVQLGYGDSAFGSTPRWLPRGTSIGHSKPLRAVLSSSGSRFARHRKLQEFFVGDLSWPKFVG